MTAELDFALGTRIVQAENAVDRLGELASELAGSRVLVVTDPGLVASGHVERAETVLRRAGHEVARYAEVREDPTTEDVDLCLAFARDFGPDLFCGLGGGSSLDVAKGANVLLAAGGTMKDYWGPGHETPELRPMIAVPTTAGSGSEVQSFALIADAETHQKMACGVPRSLPRIALLDPTLTVSMPPFITACTGLDTIGHAVETAVTKTRNAASDLFSREAFRLAARSFPRVLADPTDLAARGAMLRAAAFAGIAIENSMLGAAHSMANPLNAHHGVAHGHAVALALPVVVGFNAQDPACAETYAELARLGGLCERGVDTPTAVEALVRTLRGYLADAGLATTLRECGVTPEDERALGEEASRQWTAQHNPRPLATAEFAQLFRNAY